MALASMDIRRFFGHSQPPKKDIQAKATEQKPVEKGKVAPSNKITRKRPIIFDSDSDEEDPVPKSAKDVKKPEKNSLETITKQSKRSPVNGVKPDLNPVLVSKYFSKSPVKNGFVERELKVVTPVVNGIKKKPEKKSEKKPAKNGKKAAIEFDDFDDDSLFELTLQQLDSAEDKKPDVKAVEQKQDKKDDEVDKKRKRPASGEKKAVSSTPKTPKATPKDAAKAVSQTTPDSVKRNTNYISYLNRTGPQALGSIPIPDGTLGCFNEMTFVLTGVLESLERDEAEDLIRKYGGKVTQSLSKKTSYLVVGREPGVSKTAKADSFGTTQVDEQGFVDLITVLSDAMPKSTPVKAPKQAKTPLKSKPASQKAENKSTPVKRKLPTEPAAKSPRKKTTEPEPSDASDRLAPSDGGRFDLWVEKYKPTSTKGIVGQQGDKSNVNKLVKWVRDWHANRRKNVKPKFGRFDGEGSGFKAALLSGPPGVGKTTTVQLVLQEAGYTYTEFNASDTRSKSSLKEEVAEMLGNSSLGQYFSGVASKVNDKQCLVMDEVDGMSGNEDRGGMQELIQLIKTSKIPVICMCNDRQHPKIRSLANYCFDLKFSKPRVEQIKGMLMRICFKEGIQIDPKTLDEMIIAAGQDVRQVMNHLFIWFANSKRKDVDSKSAVSNQMHKDVKLSAFDVLRLVYSASEHKKMSLRDKSDLFFHDYSIAPLFVHENLLLVKPQKANSTNKHLELISRGCDSICDGDLVDNIIRGSQQWGLLPTQALFSSVIPGDLMEGHMTEMVQFPRWLGQHSRKNKLDRYLEELNVHMRLRISGNKTNVNLDYAPYLRDSIVGPLIAEGADGVPSAVNGMVDYHLQREDLDKLLEITQWPGKPELYSKVDSKIKAAFTRAYNKDSSKIPYSVDDKITKKSRKGAADSDDLGYGDEEEAGSSGESEGEEDNLAKVPTVKVAAKAPKASSSKAGTSKSSKPPAKKAKTK